MSCVLDKLMFNILVVIVDLAYEMLWMRDVSAPENEIATSSKPDSHMKSCNMTLLKHQWY